LRNPSAAGSSGSKDSTSVVPATRPCVRREWTLASKPAARGFFDRRTSARTIKSASETSSRPIASVELLLDRFERLQHFPSSVGWLTSQSFCGARRCAHRSLRRAYQSAERRRRRPSAETNCGTDKPDARIFAFKAAMSCFRSVDDSRGMGSCHGSCSSEREGEIAHDRAHVAVCQLEPRRANASAN